MCHLIFLIPLAGIPLFWILPWEFALLINVVLWVISVTLGYKMIKTMRLPANDGFRRLIGTEATVVSAVSPGYDRYLVKAGSEIWTARSAQNLMTGETVLITNLEGIKLVVRQLEIKSRSGK